MAGARGFTYVWEYEVPAGRQEEFVAHYAPDGTWARLFRRAAGYLGTQLYRDRTRRDRFVTVDHWQSESAYRRFRRDLAADFEALDRTCAGLTRRESHLGDLEPVPAAPERRAPKELPVRRFASQAAWAKWLASHHERSSGVWIEFAKKGSGIASVTYPEALEVALCYGWIDSQLVSVDQKRYRQRFTPRRPKSKWSRINCASVERLLAQGRLAPAGLREMEAAKQDGRWEGAYDSPRTIAVPPDLEARLARNARARRAFEQLDSRNRYAILYRLHDAKRPETRERRLEQFVTMLKAGRTIV